MMRAEHAVALLGLATISERVLAEDGSPPRSDGISCAVPAELWLSTGAALENGGNGEIHFVFSTNASSQVFTFASGTSQNDIIQSLNSYGGSLALVAEQEPLETSRVRISSVAVGLGAFVCVQQVEEGDPGIIFESVSDETGSTAKCDFGEGGFLADLDCDLDVGPSDLALLLGAWGETHHFADIDGDGTVGAMDLAILLAVWE
jgi:hypothetical protein